MNIICPADSYDPNIEPAKDDVLFTQPEAVLRIIETFFINVYGERGDVATKTHASRESPFGRTGFDILLSFRNTNLQQDQDKIPTSSEKYGSRQIFDNKSSPFGSTSLAGTNGRDASNSLLGNLASLSTRTSQDSITQPSSESIVVNKSWKSGMYDADQDHEDVLESHDAPEAMLFEEDEPASREVENLNPWTIAKLNAPVRTAKSAAAENGNHHTYKDSQLLTPAKSRADQHDYNSPQAVVGNSSLARLSTSTLLSPIQSPQSYNASCPTQLPFSTNPWAGRTQQHPLEGDRSNPLEARSVLELPERHLQDKRADSNGFISARTLPMGTALDDIPDVSERPRKQSQRKPQWQQQHGKLHKPFTSPLQNSSSVPGPPRHFGTSKKQRQPIDQEVAPSSGTFGSQDPKPSTNTGPGNGVRAMHPDLAITMDFENRKQLAMQRRREQLRQQILDMIAPNDSQNAASPSRTVSSPHKNRYNKAVAALSSCKARPQLHEPVFEPGDPRGYLARVLTAESCESSKAGIIAQQPPKRRKTANMPFEKVPLDEGMHDLVQTIGTTQEALLRQVAELVGSDSYIRSGILSNGLDCTVEEVKSWEAVLAGILKESLPMEEGGPLTDIRLDLWPIIQQHHISTT